MRTTTNQAISLLGSIAMLNERIIAFINECYPREKYCLIKKHRQADYRKSVWNTAAG